MTSEPLTLVRQAIQLAEGAEREILEDAHNAIVERRSREDET